MDVCICGQIDDVTAMTVFSYLFLGMGVNQCFLD
jgi:hypothetical protein